MVESWWSRGGGALVIERKRGEGGARVIEKQDEGQGKDDREREEGSRCGRVGGAGKSEQG